MGRHHAKQNPEIDTLKRRLRYSTRAVRHVAMPGPIQWAANVEVFILNRWLYFTGTVLESSQLLEETPNPKDVQQNGAFGLLWLWILADSSSSEASRSVPQPYRFLESYRLVAIFAQFTPCTGFWLYHTHTYTYT